MLVLKTPPKPVEGILPKFTVQGQMYKVVAHEDKDYIGGLAYATEYGLIWMKNGYGWTNYRKDTYLNNGNFLLQIVPDGTELVWKEKE